MSTTRQISGKSSNIVAELIENFDPKHPNFRPTEIYNEKWLLKAYSKNVFDNDDVMRRGQDGPQVGRFRSVTVLEPRTVGLELRLNFE